MVPCPVQSLNIKPQLATANGLASRQGNGVGQQTRTAQATSAGAQKVSSAKPYQSASTTPITVGGQTVNVFVSCLLPPTTLHSPLLCSKAPLLGSQHNGCSRDELKNIQLARVLQTEGDPQ